MYIDDILVSIATTLVTLGLVFLAGFRPIEYHGYEMKYNFGRGNRTPHTHSYDTMDAGTGGKWVCGICRKKAP